MTTTADRAAVQELIRGELKDPHYVLGPHPGPKKGTTVLRAWRPEAQTVQCVVDGETVAKLEMVDPAGLFEGTVDVPLGDYQLEVGYADGTFTLRDPYAFEPTLGELDLHLLGEGTHRRLHDFLGAHVREVDGVAGTSFAVWAPNARSVRVVGDFNSWDGRLHPMRMLGGSGIWELFLPDVGPGTFYKFEIQTATGDLLLKTDPFAFATQAPPETASLVQRSTHRFADEEWMTLREATNWHSRPMSIYEVHLGSWRRDSDGEPLTYRELAPQLADYCREMGFTHVELLPVAEHPFGGSWGYQVSHYFAPTARFGSPDDFRYLVDTLHG
ncbi:MAG: 1,4-alpha-glucan branching enzyme, partial [Actinomycetota bacterium]|nr:1,4-alpha-glucan branching enzyme [Actinomycetota bacterium]